MGRRAPWSHESQVGRGIQVGEREMSLPGSRRPLPWGGCFWFGAVRLNATILSSRGGSSGKSLVSTELASGSCPCLCTAPQTAPPPEALTLSWPLRRLCGVAGGRPLLSLCARGGPCGSVVTWGPERSRHCRGTEPRRMASRWGPTHVRGSQALLSVRPWAQRASWPPGAESAVL